MKINTALILCAGYGKRLNPLTLKVPKPLIKIENKELLLRTIELISSIGIKYIKINSFYLTNRIKEFVSAISHKYNIEIIKDGDELLNTGGGVKNLINHTNEKNFIVFNPDTIWSQNYKKIVIDMIKYFETKKLDQLLLVVHKKKSFDIRLKGDFQLKNNRLYKEDTNNYIYTGLQILNKNIFKNLNQKKFSMNKIWNDQIKKSELHGFESNQEFIHLTDIEIYKKLLKND